MTSNNEEQANAKGAAATQQPNAAKGARVAPRARRVAPAKPRSGKEATSGKGRPKKPKGRQGFKVWRWAPVRAVKRLRSSPY
jgi:hypothetical protein